MTSIALLKAAFMVRSNANLKRASNCHDVPGASAAAVYAGCRVVSDDDLSVAFDQFLKCRSTPAGPLFICQQPEIGLSRFLLAGHEGFGSAEQDSAAELGGGEFLVGPKNAPQLFNCRELLFGEPDGKRWVWEE